jgi:hypothetical protein
MSNRPVSLQDFRPEDQDIMAMSEHETACQYCGISYLILAKCERMERMVEEMQKERDEMRVSIIDVAIRPRKTFDFRASRMRRERTAET